MAHDGKCRSLDRKSTYAYGLPFLFLLVSHLLLVISAGFYLFCHTVTLVCGQNVKMWMSSLSIGAKAPYHSKGSLSLSSSHKSFFCVYDLPQKWREFTQVSFSLTCDTFWRRDSDFWNSALCDVTKGNWESIRIILSCSCLFIHRVDATNHQCFMLPAKICLVKSCK